MEANYKQNKTMKKAAFLITILIALTSISITSFGQKRPVRKTTAPVSKPKVTETPTEVEAAPVKKPLLKFLRRRAFLIRV